MAGDGGISGRGAATLLAGATNSPRPIRLANGAYFEHQVELFQIHYENTSGIVVGSMVAYMLAQYWDVQVFHYIKRFTGEKHLWLRNNLSTMTSQLIDTAVISGFTFGVALLRWRNVAKAVPNLSWQVDMPSR